MNLGVDFGSTYSMFSVYEEADDIVRALDLMGGKGLEVPSIACFDYDDNLISGQEAQVFLASERDMLPYRAFKMLLDETRPEVLAKWGYYDITPKEVSAAFLEHHMKLALNGAKKFENVVICVPEVWNREYTNMSKKNMLRDICVKTGLADNVTVVSEPAAASAFFAYLYQKKHKANYDGFFLIVDYGGGTLDLTLTKVNTITYADGNSSIEIDVVGRTGVGENHDGQVGDAGIAYMDGIVMRAMREAKILKPGEHVDRDGFFLATLNQLEATLMGNTQLIADVLNSVSFDPDIMADNHTVFKTLSYKGKKVPVTFSTLYITYKEVIRPVLDKQLEDIHRYVRKELGIDPTVSGAEGLKIALVGGFGRFAMVQHQIREKYHISNPEIDPHLVHMNLGEQEGAISFGAALLANGVVKLRKTAEQSFGMVSYLGDTGTETFDYAITYHQDVRPNTVYYCRRNPDPAFPDRDVHEYYLTPNGADYELPVKFAIGTNDNLNEAYCLVPLPEIRRKLCAIPSDDYAFGFSMDESGVYTFHISPVKNGKPMGEIKSCSLGVLADVFGPIVRKNESTHLTK